MESWILGGDAVDVRDAENDASPTRKLDVVSADHPVYYLLGRGNAAR